MSFEMFSGYIKDMLVLRILNVGVRVWFASESKLCMSQGIEDRYNPPENMQQKPFVVCTTAFRFQHSLDSHQVELSFQIQRWTWPTNSQH